MRSVNDQERKAAATTIIRMDWRTQLIKTEKGAPKPIFANALIALRGDHVWSGVLAFNEFAAKIETQKSPPWGKSARTQWSDNDVRLTAEWLQREGILVSTNTAGEAALTVSEEHRFHPVQQYLEKLVWDGERRIDSWVNRYLGVDPNKEIARVFGRCWLRSAVARILQPGCKTDSCLILEGPQGILKSTALRTLAGEWFTDQLPELGSKDSYMQCHGVWIVEIAELDSINRSDVSRIKAFMSATSDRFRLPYGRNVVEWPRDCVFAGSVNKDTYLRDETGGRRFWPVQCGRIDIRSLAHDRDQLWAEAVADYNEGEHWWIENGKLTKLAEQEQAQRYEVDPWAEKISNYLLSAGDEVSSSEILTHLGKPAGQWTRADDMRVAAFLKSQGWTKFRDRVGTYRPWMYRKSQ